MIKKIFPKRQIQHKRNSVFIFQAGDGALKVIKCQPINNSRLEITGLELETLTTDLDEKKINEKILQAFKKLEYSHQPVIVSLPRSKATCRNIKIPSQSAKEIEKIIPLQASRYLPFPANELITGYQILSAEKDGYSDINLIIAHKDAIERYTMIFLKELKAPGLTINLSSYGILNFYCHLNPEGPQTAMLIDIDSSFVEAAIVSDKKFVFGRYFKIDRSQAGWESFFINEIKKTQDVYLKELSREQPKKIIFTGALDQFKDFIQNLSAAIGLPVETLSYDRLNLAGIIRNKILASGNSFTSILGLGMGSVQEELNLLPQDIKEQTRSLTLRKEQLWLLASIACTILVLGLAVASHLENKGLYLKRLKIELNKFVKDARPLEDIERRFRLLENRSKKKTSGLEALYELCGAMPKQVFLVSFNYEEEKQIIIRGQAPELNSVFDFVAGLEKSPLFHAYNIKVRYATKKRMQSGEIVDFEIACLRK